MYYIGQRVIVQDREIAVVAKDRPDTRAGMIAIRFDIGGGAYCYRNFLLEHIKPLPNGQL